MPGRLGSAQKPAAGEKDDGKLPSSPPSQPPAAAEDEAPEPETEAVSGKWGQRMDELMVRLQEAVGAKDFRKALHVQKEMELVTRSMETSDEFEKKISAAEAAMLQAASRQSYLEAEQYKEEVEFLRTHKDEVIELETQMLALELAFLSHTTSKEKVDLHKAWDTRKEVELLEGIRDEMVRKEERLAALREGLRRALAERNFSGAEVLKEQIQQLKNYNPATAMRTDLTPAAALPLEDDGRAPFPASQPRSVRDMPPAAAPQPPPPAPHPAAVPAHATPGQVPQHPPAGYASQPQPLYAPQPAAPSPVAPDDIVANLAAMIWRSSCGDASGALPQLSAPAALPPKQQLSTAAVSPARSEWSREGHYRRRLLNFYQHYNPTKLPSVRLALQEYKGEEEKLIQNLVNKYGPEPPDLFELPLPAGWRLVENAAGDVFYVSNDNKKQWERPVVGLPGHN